MDKNQKRKVILVTDGDTCAQKTIEVAVRKVGGRCISRSGGNPTPIQSSEIVKLIKKARNDPVVVMVDDRGHTGTGQGEQAMFELVNHPEIEVIGIVAVASNTKGVRGVRVDYSIDNNGNIVKAPVDKYGNVSKEKVLIGDTVDIINNCNVPIVIGLGDIGKMEGKDEGSVGAPIVTKALEEIININKYKKNKRL